MSTSKSLVLAFIWILLLSFIFMLFVCILGAVVKKTSAGSNWDEITTSGVYYVVNGASATGAPNGAYGWGTLVVMSSVSQGGVKGVVQMYFENNTEGGRVWQRNRWQTVDGFRPWAELTTNMPTFYKDYNDLASLQTALGVNKKLRNLGTLSVDAGATNTTNVGAYAGVLFIINQDYGHVSIIATSYNHFTEIVHESSAGSFSASCVNKTLSITNNGSSQVVYSISLLL